MSAPDPHSSKATGIELERLMFFSDAVFAIAITLLVLEIKVPEREAIHSSAELLSALGDLFPRFFAFFLSFIVIGYYWITHHTMFRYIQRWNEVLIVLNLALLMSVAFLPFPVALLGSFRHFVPALVFYASTLAVTGLLQSLLWLYATRRHRLVDVQLDAVTIRILHFRSLVMPAVFAVSIVLAFLSPTWAMFSWVLMAPAIRLVRGRLQRDADKAKPQRK